MTSLAKEIVEFSKRGICTKGYMTYACGCPKCLKEKRDMMLSFFKKRKLTKDNV